MKIESKVADKIIDKWANISDKNLVRYQELADRLKVSFEKH